MNDKIIGILRLLFRDPVFKILFTFLTAVLTASIYFVGYTYDAIFGNVFLYLGHKIGVKYPEVKKNPQIQKIWSKIQPKNLYLRYETPFYTYILCYPTIVLSLWVLDNKGFLDMIAVDFLYVLIYLIGMVRRCGWREQYFGKILKNNKEFLKLSFLPFKFLVTSLSIAISILEFFDSNFEIKAIALTNFCGTVKEICDILSRHASMAVLEALLEVVLMIIIFLIMCYILSFPIQLIAYLCLSIIDYFYKYKTGYKVLYSAYMKLLDPILKLLF